DYHPGYHPVSEIHPESGCLRAMYGGSVGVNAEWLLEQALALPASEREVLASVGGPDAHYSPERAEAFASEIERRIERFVAGESEGVDLPAARHRARASLAGDRDVRPPSSE